MPTNTSPTLGSSSTNWVLTFSITAEDYYYIILRDQYYQTLVTDYLVNCKYPYGIPNSSISQGGGIGFTGGLPTIDTLTMSHPTNPYQYRMTKGTLNVSKTPFIIAFGLSSDNVWFGVSGNSSYVPYIGISTNSNTGNGNGSTSSGFIINLTNGLVYKNNGDNVSVMSIPNTTFTYNTKCVLMGDGNGNYYYGTGTTSIVYGPFPASTATWPTSFTKIVGSTVNPAEFTSSAPAYITFGSTWHNLTNIQFMVGYSIINPTS